MKHRNLEDSGVENSVLSDIMPLYYWEDPHSIIVQVQNSKYYLQGLNATLFAHLSDSPLLHGQLLSGKGSVAKLLLGNLAVALATIDRASSEPATAEILQALWLKEKRTGIKRFVELLAQRQWRDGRWEGYRDHLNHTLKVYLTGLYLYESCQALRDRLLESADCGEPEFLRRWLYASTFHDVGYIFELTGPGRVAENLGFFHEYIQNFLYYHDQDLSQDLLTEGLKPGTIDRKHARQVLSLVGLHIRDLQSAEDLGIVWNSDINLWDRLDELCRGTGIGNRGITGYFTRCLTQQPPMVSGRAPFFDHGIIGAVILLHLGYAQRAIFEGLKQGLLPNSSQGQVELHRTGRAAVLKKMTEWAGDLDGYVQTIEHAATAIALHNVYKDAWRPNEIPWQVDLSNYWIKLDDYPLAFLLILVDILQDWDRPGFNPTKPKRKPSLQASNIDIRSDGQKVLVGYLDRPGDEYDRTLEELNKVLLPSQVERFIGPLDVREMHAQPLRHSSHLREYNRRVVERLKGDWFDRFINLYMIPMRLRTESGGPDAEQYDVFEIAAKFQETPVAFLGEPGAGKTTLAEMLAIQYADKGPRIPIFVEMGLYSGQDDLQDMLDLPLDSLTLANLLNHGKFLIIFDGLNEVGLSLQELAARAIARFMQEYRKNQFIITCRTAEYPTYLRAPVQRFEVIPIEPETVRSYLIEFLGPDLGSEICSSMPSRVRDMCRNPLLLTMLTYIYMGEERPTRSPASKAALYELFLEQLYAREEELRAIELPQAIREEFLRHLALRMDNRIIAARRRDAQEWISELYRSRYQGTGYDLPRVFYEVLNLPPMKASQPGRHSAEVEVSFMHQSFQEYYTACAILLNLAQEDASFEELVPYASPDNEHWWETLSLLVGMMDDATPAVQAIKKCAESVAESRGDQRSYTLVARCIRESRYVDPVEVDDTIIRTLLAFKFGKVPFDYDLIYSLKLIRPEQRSSDFPVRLIEDVNWWLSKYARASATKLDKSIPIEVLLDYVEADDEGLVLDALFTLCEHEDRARALEQLVSKLERSRGIVREQLIATLGYLKGHAAVAVGPLVGVINDPKETKWARAFALNALGKIGDSRAAADMILYMLDHDNPYRDSASWGLQYIAKANPHDSNLHAELKQAYIQALLSETDDLEGRYAKGNIVYSLGELGATEYAKEIAHWLESETDPYVLEDGIQALGQLPDPRMYAIIVAHLSNADPVVRMMAVGALVSVAQASTEEIDLLAHLQPMLSDRTAIVKEAAEEAIRAFQEKPAT